MDGHEDGDGQQGEQLGVDGEGSEGNIQGTKVRRYNWHSARSMGWPFPMLKYK